MRTCQQRCDEILQYLEVNPDAGDTVEGIAEWWLTHHDGNESKVLIQQALNHLVKQGLVERHVLVERTIVYQLAPLKPST